MSKAATTRPNPMQRFSLKRDDSYSTENTTEDDLSPSPSMMSATNNLERSPPVKPVRSNFRSSMKKDAISSSDHRKGLSTSEHKPSSYNSYGSKSGSTNTTSNETPPYDLSPRKPKRFSSVNDEVPTTRRVLSKSDPRSTKIRVRRVDKEAPAASSSAHPVPRRRLSTKQKSRRKIRSSSVDAEESARRSAGAKDQQTGGIERRRRSNSVDAEKLAREPSSAQSPHRRERKKRSNSADAERNHGIADSADTNMDQSFKRTGSTDMDRSFKRTGSTDMDRSFRRTASTDMDRSLRRSAAHTQEGRGRNRRPKSVDAERNSRGRASSVDAERTRGRGRGRSPVVDRESRWRSSSVDAEARWRSNSVDPEARWRSNSVDPESRHRSSSADPERMRRSNSMDPESRGRSNFMETSARGRSGSMDPERRGRQRPTSMDPETRGRQRSSSMDPEARGRKRSSSADGERRRSRSVDGERRRSRSADGERVRRSTSVDAERRQRNNSVDPERRQRNTSIDPEKRQRNNAVDPERRQRTNSTDPERRRRRSIDAERIARQSSTQGPPSPERKRRSTSVDAEKVRRQSSTNPSGHEKERRRLRSNSMDAERVAHPSRSSSTKSNPGDVRRRGRRTSTTNREAEPKSPLARRGRRHTTTTTRQKDRRVGEVPLTDSSHSEEQKSPQQLSRTAQLRQQESSIRQLIRSPRASKSQEFDPFVTKSGSSPNSETPSEPATANKCTSTAPFIQQGGSIVRVASKSARASGGGFFRKSEKRNAQPAHKKIGAMLQRKAFKTLDESARFDKAPGFDKSSSSLPDVFSFEDSHADMDEDFYDTVEKPNSNKSLLRRSKSTSKESDRLDDPSDTPASPKGRLMGRSRKRTPQKHASDASYEPPTGSVDGDSTEDYEVPIDYPSDDNKSVDNSPHNQKGSLLRRSRKKKSKEASKDIAETPYEPPIASFEANFGEATASSSSFDASFGASNRSSYDANFGGSSKSSFAAAFGESQRSASYDSSIRETPEHTSMPEFPTEDDEADRKPNQKGSLIRRSRKKRLSEKTGKDFVETAYVPPPTEVGNSGHSTDNPETERPDSESNANDAVGLDDLFNKASAHAFDSLAEPSICTPPKESAPECPDTPTFDANFADIPTETATKEFPVDDDESLEKPNQKGSLIRRSRKKKSSEKAAQDFPETAYEPPPSNPIETPNDPVDENDLFGSSSFDPSMNLESTKVEPESTREAAFASFPQSSVCPPTPSKEWPPTDGKQQAKQELGTTDNSLMEQFSKSFSGPVVMEASKPKNTANNLPPRALPPKTPQPPPDKKDDRGIKKNMSNNLRTLLSAARGKKFAELDDHSVLSLPKPAPGMQGSGTENPMRTGFAAMESPLPGTVSPFVGNSRLPTPDDPKAFPQLNLAQFDHPAKIDESVEDGGRGESEAEEHVDDSSEEDDGFDEEFVRGHDQDGDTDDVRIRFGKEDDSSAPGEQQYLQLTFAMPVNVAMPDGSDDTKKKGLFSKMTSVQP